MPLVPFSDRWFIVDFEHAERWLNWKLMNQGRAETTITKYRRYP